MWQSLGPQGEPSRSDEAGLLSDLQVLGNMPL